MTDSTRVQVDEAALRWFYDTLLTTYGPQHWWPTTDPDHPRFEILIGAVLTQHTAWTQVEKAIATLRAAGSLTPETVVDHGDALPDLIRPAGPHNVKAERLRALCGWFIDAGGFAALDNQATDTLRASLQSCRGVGAETADAILVYVFERQRFIADTYAFRVVERLGWSTGPRYYERLRKTIEAAEPGAAGPAFYNELHALIVAHAKTRCHKNRPDCDHCALRPHCDFGNRTRSAPKAQVG